MMNLYERNARVAAVQGIVKIIVEVLTQEQQEKLLKAIAETKETLLNAPLGRLPEIESESMRNYALQTYTDVEHLLREKLDKWDEPHESERG